MSTGVSANLQTVKPPLLYDRWLLFTTIALLSLGLLMVASASMVISDRLFGQPFYFLFHQMTFLGLGIVVSWYGFQFRMQKWQAWSAWLLLFSFLLLALVLMPGLGHEVNGSMRWLGIGPIGIQVSEVAKLTVILYLASYLVRRQEEVRTRISGFLKPLFVVGVIAILLLKEPDFGALAVIAATTLGMLFLAGVRPWQFMIVLCAAITIMALLAVASPYRLQRLVTFTHPWANAYSSGYQLTQSLIAFGHGGWLGVGLGHSVQKLFYLPEAYTDFLFAVLAEELGLIGALAVIALFVLLIGRAFYIGFLAYQQNLTFSAYVAYGIGLWLALQAIINMGVNMGLFPTKGLTLPLMSYGGSSMLIDCFALMLLLRVDYERRIYALGLQRTVWPD